ncbi:hypothetical protein PLICRDRAFT_33387 [Plicaturopsis crispa FD-325 SS-3]|nr:hypothetical protein PLICRDRAFT_33387 [Plicaturopsis crispa FD-325 SS-3]
MTAPAYPPFDFHQFVWKPSDDPSVQTRYIAGPEVYADMVNRFQNGSGTLFVGAEISLRTPISTSDFLTHARGAWITLRAAVPTIASGTAQDVVGRTILTYRVAKDAANVRSWADRTVLLKEDDSSLIDLRLKLATYAVPDANGDQTFLHLIPRSSTRYGLLLHTAHLPFDGAAVKIVISRFLQILSKSISDPVIAAGEQTLHWGDEWKNLPPPASEVLSPDEPIHGHAYDETMHSVLSDLERLAPHARGYRRRVEPAPVPIYRRANFTFSAEESAAIITGARRHGFTVNEICHASIFLSAYFDDPPSDSTAPDAALVTHPPRDARDRLREPYSRPGQYPGTALGLSPIAVPVSVITAALRAGDSGVALLSAVAAEVNKEYAKQKGYPALLGIMPQQVDIMTTKAVKDSVGSRPSARVGPEYSGDGVVEKFLDHTYASTDWTTVLDLTDFLFSMNAPVPTFRLNTFRNLLTLSVDWDDAVMPEEAVDGFLKTVVEQLRLVL